MSSSVGGGRAGSKHGLFAAIAVPASSALALLVACAWALLSLYVQPRLEKQWGTTAELLARQYASLAGQILRQTEAAGQAFADEQANGQNMHSIDMRSLDRWRIGQPLVSAAYWVDAMGTVAAASTGSPGRDEDFKGMSLENNPEFSKARSCAKCESGWSAVFLSGATRQAAVARFFRTRGGFLAVELDQNKLSERLRAEAGASERISLALIDAKGQLVAHSKPALGKQLANIGGEELLRSWSKSGGSYTLGKIEGREVLASFVELPGQGGGWRAAVFVDKQVVFSSLGEAVTALGALFAAAATLAVLGCFALARGLSRSVLALEARARDLAGGAGAAAGAFDSSIKEIASVGASLDTMFNGLLERERALVEHQSQLEEVVEERSRGLVEANAELKEALEQVKQAQASLVESEKMASLGALVAGVAHELNTPIGNAYLSSTSVDQKLSELSSALAAGTGSKREFASGLQKASELSRMASAALERSADLVKSFKRVAVDQSSSQGMVAFEMDALARDAMASFQAGLDKCGGVTWSVSVVEGSKVSMVSNPGAWIQVLSNFFNNALLHAFEGGKGGSIAVSIKSVGSDIEVGFCDDGVGMSEAVRRKAFDPFFTTKPGSGGGSGIGLHVCYQLVQTALGGRVWIDEEHLRGTRIVVRAPRDLGARSMRSDGPTQAGEESDPR